MAELASGAITAFDTVTMELGEADDTPAIVIVRWPAKATVFRQVRLWRSRASRSVRPHLRSSRWTLRVLYRPLKGVVCYLLPSVLSHCVVRASRELLIFSDRVVVAVVPDIRLVDRWRHEVVFSTRYEQQRCPIFVPEVDVEILVARDFALLASHLDALFKRNAHLSSDESVRSERERTALAVVADIGPDAGLGRHRRPVDLPVLAAVSRNHAGGHHHPTPCR